MEEKDLCSQPEKFGLKALLLLLLHLYMLGLKSLQFYGYILLAT